MCFSFLFDHLQQKFNDSSNKIIRMALPSALYVAKTKNNLATISNYSAK